VGAEAGAAGSGCFGVGEDPSEHEAIPIINTKAIEVLSKTGRTKLSPFYSKTCLVLVFCRKIKKPTLFVWAGWGGNHLNPAFPRRPR